jgi:hypothetical protein
MAVASEDAFEAEQMHKSTGWPLRRFNPAFAFLSARIAVARHRVLDEMRRWVFWRAANPSSPVQCRVGAKKQIIGLQQQDQRVDSWPGPAQRSF